MRRARNVLVDALSEIKQAGVQNTKVLKALPQGEVFARFQLRASSVNVLDKYNSGRRHEVVVAGQPLNQHSHGLSPES